MAGTCNTLVVATLLILLEEAMSSGSGSDQRQPPHFAPHKNRSPFSPVFSPTLRPGCLRHDGDNPWLHCHFYVEVTKGPPTHKWRAQVLVLRAKAQGHPCPGRFQALDSSVYDLRIPIQSVNVALSQSLPTLS